MTDLITLVDSSMVEVVLKNVPLGFLELHNLNGTFLLNCFVGGKLDFHPLNNGRSSQNYLLLGRESCSCMCSS